MIFVTVGTQLPFERLVDTVDRWAARHGHEDVFAQIGPGARSPEFIASRASITPAEFRRAMETAQWIIGHAGMGTIITALELGKPLLIMPRRASLGEHRNDHQFATVKQLSVLRNVQVADDEHELDQLLEQGERTTPVSTIPRAASPELLSTVRQFINTPPVGHRAWEWAGNRGRDVGGRRMRGRRLARTIS